MLKSWAGIRGHAADLVQLTGACSTLMAPDHDAAAICIGCVRKRWVDVMPNVQLTYGKGCANIQTDPKKHDTPSMVHIVILPLSTKVQPTPKATEFWRCSIIIKICCSLSDLQGFRRNKTWTIICVCCSHSKMNWTKMNCTVSWLLYCEPIWTTGVSLNLYLHLICWPPMYLWGHRF